MSKTIVIGNGTVTNDTPIPTSGTINLTPTPQTSYTQEQLKALIQENFNKQGRFAWAKKHEYKGCDPQWHELWELLIPRNGCSCTEDYAKLKSEDPPDFSSPEAYWLWGFRLHNKINVKLERPELSLEDAKKLWNR